MAATLSRAVLRFFQASSRSRLRLICCLFSVEIWAPSQDFCGQYIRHISRLKQKDTTVTVTLRLPPNQTFNGSLGDYTQWVHLACPHWSSFHSTWSVQAECKKRRRGKLFSDHSRLPAVAYDLGDYTKWVHSVCPH